MPRNKDPKRALEDGGAAEEVRKSIYHWIKDFVPEHMHDKVDLEINELRYNLSKALGLNPSARRPVAYSADELKVADWDWLAFIEALQATQDERTRAEAISSKYMADCKVIHDQLEALRQQKDTACIESEAKRTAILKPAIERVVQSAISKLGGSTFYESIKEARLAEFQVKRTKLNSDLEQLKEEYADVL